MQYVEIYNQEAAQIYHKGMDNYFIGGVWKKWLITQQTYKP